MDFGMCKSSTACAFLTKSLLCQGHEGCGQILAIGDQAENKQLQVVRATALRTITSILHFLIQDFREMSLRFMQCQAATALIVLNAVAICLRFAKEVIIQVLAKMGFMRRMRRSAQEPL